MRRREFLATLSCMASFRPAFGQASVTPEAAREIYRRSIVIDALATSKSMNVPWPPDGPLSKIQIESASSSGISAVNATVSSDFEGSARNIAFWYSEVEKSPAVFTIIRKHSDIERARRNRQLGVILGFQDTEMLARNVSRLDLFHGLGVRIIQLTYNFKNAAGDGCLEPEDSGLTEFGREVVSHMNRLGIAVDLSHCGTRTTADGIAASTKPPLITHSGCREIYRHPRSKEDQELRAMAKKGGVVGIYFIPFIGGGPGPATEALLMRHIEHALNVCGSDHVGIGSDLSVTPVEETPEYLNANRQIVERRKQRGPVPPDDERTAYIPELNTSRRLELIAVALARRGHSSSVIEKVIGGNFHRVLAEIWGKA